MMLGELLIAEGALDPEGLQEALDWQVLYGGRLGTNLLELRLVEEPRLARALGKQHGCEVAFGELAPSPELLGLVPRHVADRQEIVPWKIERRRLKVLCAIPQVAVFDELAIKLNRICTPVVAPEFRIIQLLRREFGAKRQMRALDFGVVPEEQLAERRRKKKKAAGAAAEAAPELIDEAAFNDIYSQVLAGRDARPSGAGIARPPSPPETIDAPVKPARPAARALVAQPPQEVQEPIEELVELDDLDVLDVLEPLGELPEGEASEQTAIELKPLGAFALSHPEPSAEEHAERRARAPQSETSHPAPLWDMQPPEPEPLDATPLAFKDAVAQLNGVTDRDAIAHIVLRCARGFAARALLLTVQGGVALGWDGLGEGLEGAAARAVAVPLLGESVFQLVVKMRSHYMGALKKTPANVRFLAQTGKKIPLSVLVLPILFRGRVSHLLYLDNGHKEQAPTDVGEMLILAQKVTQTVDALVAKKQRSPA